MRDRHEAKEDELSTAIAGLERQLATLGDAVVEPAISALREQLAQLKSGTVDQTPADERTLVTIVFADVSGFTALSEKVDPEKVRELTNACFDWLVPVVEKYGGTIDKFIGDEIMALFGAPIAHGDDAQRALRAALEMMRGLLNENQYPMPEKLCVATREAIEQWHNGAKKAASSNLEAAVQLATDLHYL